MQTTKCESTEVLLKGKAQYSWSPYLDQPLLKLKVLFTFFTQPGGQLYWAFPFS